ncbi:MAG: serine/threonine-protein kinase [Pirellulaceae bacterium]
MSNGDWSHLNELFHQAMEQPADGREDFLRNAQIDSDVLRMLLNCVKFADSDGLQAPLQPDQNPILFAADSESIVSNATSQIGHSLSTESATYRLENVIGAGGTGVVYLATQTDSSKQQVAIKVLRNELTGSDTVRRRFDLERQLLEQLDHTSVGRILDSGTTSDGRPFLVMELIHGISITDYAYQEQLPLQARLQLFLDACQAVAFAHSRGIVHRDIKPSHILVNEDGIVKLVDFGIAKADSVATSLLGLTRMGESPMTPAYASPEQVLGKPVGVESDVYSLGVVLYQLITGQHPYPTSTNLLEMAARICNQPPHRPSVSKPPDSDNRGPVESMAETAKPTKTSSATDDLSSLPDTCQTVPFPLSHLKGDMDEIVLKSLRKEPRLRYRTVYELSDDIVRYLENKPVTARRENRIYNLRKFASQHWWSVTLLSFVLVSLIVALWITQRSLRHTEVARQQAAFGMELEEIKVASSRLELGYPGDAYQRLRPFLIDETTGILRNDISFERRHLLYRITDELEVETRAALPKFNQMGTVLLGSQEKLAVASRRYQENKFALWDVQSLLADGKPVFFSDSAFPFLSNYFISAIAYAPERNRVVYSTQDDRALILAEANTGRILQRIAVEDHLRVAESSAVWMAHLSMSHDEQFVASVDIANQLSVWRLSDDSIQWLETVQVPDFNYHRLTFSPDGTQIACSGSNQLMIYDRSPLALRHQIPLPKSIEAVAYHPTLPQIVATTLGKDVHVYSTTDGQLLRSEREPVAVRQIAFSHDGQLAAEACVDGRVNLKRFDDGKIVKTIAALTSSIADVRFVDNSRALVVTDEKQRGVCWPVPGTTSVLSERVHKSTEQAFQELNTGAAMGSCIVKRPPANVVGTCDTSNINLWNAQDGSLLRQMPVAAGSVWGAEFTRDGKYVLSYEYHRERGDTLHVMNPLTGEEILSETERGVVASGPFDSLMLNAVSNQDALQLRSLETPTQVIQIPVNYPPSQIRFANQQRQVAVAGNDMIVRIYRYTAENLTLEQEIPVPTLGTQLRVIEFSPDDRWLALGGNKSHLIWNLAAGKIEAEFSNRGQCNTMSFSPDGRRLATVNYFGPVRVWEVETWREVWESPTSLGFFEAGWSASGDVLFGLTLENTLHAWRTVPTDQILGQIQQIDSLLAIPTKQ